MVRNIVVLGGSSHPRLTNDICEHLGIPSAKILLGKFAVGETRVEIIESVREKDVFIIQSGGGKVNDHLMELLITISACKTASAKRVTAVLPLFPYSRQSDIPYNKTGAPLARVPTSTNKRGNFTFDSTPTTPYPGQQESAGLKNGSESLHKKLHGLQLRDQVNGVKDANGITKSNRRLTVDSAPDKADYLEDSGNALSPTVTNASVSGEERSKPPVFEPQRGYKQWVAQAGTLVADLLTCAGADHIITMDLHDPQYQGFFDIPVDNLYGRHLLRRYIKTDVPNFQQAVVVSPDAGGAKRATAIADSLNMPFALIHKVDKMAQNGVRSANISDRSAAQPE